MSIFCTIYAYVIRRFISAKKPCPVKFHFHHNLLQATLTLHLTQLLVLNIFAGHIQALLLCAQPDKSVPSGWGNLPDTENASDQSL